MRLALAWDVSFKHQPSLPALSRRSMKLRRTAVECPFYRMLRDV